MTSDAGAARVGRLRVVIAEDSVLLLAGLTKLLDSAGFEVCATAGDADSLLAVVEREQPDVVIADVRMPPSHTDEGIRAALVIRRQWPDVAILVLSQYVEERYAAELLSANTRGLGYLLKDRVADVAEFLDALRRVAAGGTALDPEVVAQLLVRTGGNPLDGLTQRERDVLALMAEGRSNTEIGAALVITEGAVSKHINSIFAKLELYPGDVGHRRVLAVLRYLGVEPGLSGPFDGDSPDISLSKSLCHDREASQLRRTVCPRLAAYPYVTRAHCCTSEPGRFSLPHRSRRYVRMAGALALATGSLVAGGLPATASIAIGPMLHSRFMSAQQPATPAQCEAIFTAPCYGPDQLQAAYDVQPLFNSGITGAGQTIVIVDSFGSPTIKADLAVFDAEYNLPAPPSLKVIQPAGPVPAYDPTDANGDVGWAGETTLDVEWAHSMAPGANILLVETPVDETEGTAGMPQIVKAENYVINHHLGQVISQSFGATEGTFPSAASIQGLRSANFNAARNHVTMLAATGDAGATDFSDPAGTILYTHRAIDWPSSDPLVTAVGGTQLALLSTGQRTQADRVWNDSTNYALNDAFSGDPDPTADGTGGGISTVFARPSYQNSVAGLVGDHRGVPDISMSAACSGLVNTYQSFGGQPAGWYVDCGTSEATPLFAGIVALADQLAGHSLGLINPALYALSAAQAPGLVDVTAGNNSATFIQNNTLFRVKGFWAGPGYDLASGVGTVNADLFVPELVQAASVGS